MILKKRGTRIPFKEVIMSNRKPVFQTGQSAGPKGVGFGFIRAMAAATSIFVAASAFAFAGDSAKQESKAGAAASREKEVSISKVNKNPADYLGKTVTLKGKVNEVVGPNAVRIRSGGFFGGSEILVVDRAGFPPEMGTPAEAADKDLEITVTGPVRIFNRVEFESDWGIDLDQELFTVYEGQPAVVVDRLSFGGEQQQDNRLGSATGSATGSTTDSATGGSGVGMGTEGGTAGGTGNQAMDTSAQMDLSRMLQNTDQYFGDTVTVTGYVAKIVDSNAFSLSPTQGTGGDGILVIAGKDNPRLTAGSKVKVSGLVRSFDRRQFESELSVDLDDALYGAWDQDPSIRANSISTLESPTASRPGEYGSGGSGNMPGDTAEGAVDSLWNDTSK